MTSENPNNNCNDYSVNINTEDLINIYVRKWVLKWCKEYHPEAFEEAEKFIRNLYNENNQES
jgi:energy-converting hydrogenase A subunit M